MTPTPQTEAQRLAARNEECAKAWLESSDAHKFRKDTAAELRRLDAVEKERDHITGLYNDVMGLLNVVTDERDQLKADYKRLMEKHNNLHINAKQCRTERDQLRAQVEAATKARIEAQTTLYAERERLSAMVLAEQKAHSSTLAKVERLQGGEPVPSMHRILMQGAADMIKLLCSMKHGEMDLAGTDMGYMIDNLNAAANGQTFAFGEPSPAWVKAMTAPAQPAAPALVPLTPHAIRAEFVRLQNDESQSFIGDLHDFTQGARFAERFFGIGQPVGGEGA